MDIGDKLINALESMTIWEMLNILRHCGIVFLCVTIAITIIFAVASPLPAAWHWYKTKCSDAQIAYPFFIGLTDNVCWFTYGIFRRDWGMIALNIYCMSMTTLYIVTMYIYRTNRIDMNRLILIWVLFMIVVQGYLNDLNTNEEAAKVIGRITVCIQTTGASGLVYLLYKILKAWRLDFLPFYPIALGFTIETQVFLLGLLKQDRYLMMANGFFMTMNGIIFCLFYVLPADRQLILPDLFTFAKERALEVYSWLQERRKLKKVYSPRKLIFDINENLLV